MHTDEIREKFLQFFEDKGHRRVASDGLIPHNDPTLLFTGAGMNQFKTLFLGLEKADYTRATTSQKCLRTGDLDNVGRTFFHHSFFEMLGNFSFGDYFKEEAVTWAWEFFTEVLELPPERLQVSVYEDDDEAFAVWRDTVGVPEERIFRLDAKENFWPANAVEDGPNGPCGPCSEIFYDFGPVPAGCDSDPCDLRCECGRWAEIWNLVFTQYERRDGGVLEDLPQRNIDTGMGLERLAAVMQGVRSNYQTDLLAGLTEAGARELGVDYHFESDSGARLRRIADHVRAVCFCIADGALPGSEGRGYVVRRVLRKAFRDGAALLDDAGAEPRPFLHNLASAVRERWGGAYPELNDRAEVMDRILHQEEQQYLTALQQGTAYLEEKLDALEEDGAGELPGDVAFHAYDTLGLPFEETVEIAQARGFEVDRAGFEARLEEAKEEARAAGPMQGEVFVRGALDAVRRDLPDTEFLGWEHDDAEGTVVAIARGDETVERAGAGDRVGVVLDRTPFYAEGGGQVGDSGELTADGVRLTVDDTQQDGALHVHHATVEKGEVAVGDVLTARVDAEARDHTRRNHSATHLLHAVLRETLGDHVKQQGSLVAPDRLRFDFTHFEPLTDEQIADVERRVNERIRRNAPVTWEFMSKTESEKAGAIAFFGDKYGEEVRVLRMGQEGELSVELCGGTHVERTGDIGGFRILSEAGIGSGVRRLECITGAGATEVNLEQAATLRRAAAEVKAAPEDLADRVADLQQRLKEARKEVSELKRQAAAGGGAGGDLWSDGVVRGDVHTLAARVDGLGGKELMNLADQLRDRHDSTALVLVGDAGDGKVAMVATVTRDLPERGLKAGDLVRDLAPLVGGGGGGRPDMAQAGGRDASGIPRVLEAAAERFEEVLGAPAGA